MTQLCAMSTTPEAVDMRGPWCSFARTCQIGVAVLPTCEKAQPRMQGEGRGSSQSPGRDAVGHLPASPVVGRGQAPGEDVCPPRAMLMWTERD